MWRVDACVLRSFDMAVNLKASYLFCTKCAQFVSSATYYRHMKLGICPGNEDGEPDVALDDVCPGNADGEPDVTLDDVCPVNEEMSRWMTYVLVTKMVSQMLYCKT